MKSQFLTSIISLLSLYSLILLTPYPTEAKPAIKFHCDRDHDGTPTTFAKTINDDVAIIRWERWLGNFSPQQRCERVSAKFQEANENGTLDLIQNGWHNGQKVICTAIQVNGGCHTVLITLRPEDNSERILNDLVEEIGYSRKLGPLSHSGGESHIYYQIDLEAFWENIGKR